MIKKILKIAVIVAVVALVAIQLWRPDRTNASIDPKVTIEAQVDVPEDVSAILDRSCNDCHSEKTAWPWYSNVAPVSWGVADHVHEGRRELNFSVWGTYKDRRKSRKLKEVCEQVEQREMPHSQYLWLHSEAALSDKDISTLCGWAKGLMKQIVSEDPKSGGEKTENK
jgi:hypothetical protein